MTVGDSNKSDAAMTPVHLPPHCSRPHVIGWAKRLTLKNLQQTSIPTIGTARRTGPGLKIRERADSKIYWKRTMGEPGAERE